MSCYDCGLKYGSDAWIEAIIPDKIWARIRPEKDETSKTGGILCISCIVRRLNILGYKNVPIWLCGTEPIISMRGDPGESIEILREWSIKDCKENLGKET